jgi:hypothetical protein
MNLLSIFELVKLYDIAVISKIHIILLILSFLIFLFIRFKFTYILIFTIKYTCEEIIF